MSADLLAAFGNGVSTDDVKNSSPPAGVSLSRTDLPAKQDDTWQPWPRAPQQIAEPDQGELWRSQAGGGDVLFDADEDEFGDFELAPQDLHTVPPSSVKDVSLERSVDLLGLNDAGVGTERPASERSKTSPASLPQVVEQSVQDDDDWGGFEDASDSEMKADIRILNKQKVSGTRPTNYELETPGSGIVENHQPESTGPALLDNTKSDGFDEWDNWEDNSGNMTRNTNPASSLTQMDRAPISGKQERPTNIPPPAVLLNLIPKVLSSLASNLTKGSPTETGLQVLEVYKVCARSIAGRSLRWKRDTILAQSMRMGAAGRSGGMKLTVLDRGETRKEDQEVEEVLSTWSRLSLKLNSAMSKAKVQKPPLSLSANIVVRTAMGSDIISSTHPCPVCGLKRNERINGIDVNVLDTFGEFWVEYWGHKDCHDFWYQYNNLLDQR